MWNPNSLMELKLKSTICHLPRSFQPGLFPSSIAKISLPPDQHRRPGHWCRQVTQGESERGCAGGSCGRREPRGCRSESAAAPGPAAGTGGAAGAATCRAPPAAPACPSCHGCAWPGRARAAWRGPAPRSAPPARTWRGCWGRPPRPGSPRRRGRSGCSRRWAPSAPAARSARSAAAHPPAPPPARPGPPRPAARRGRWRGWRSRRPPPEARPAGRRSAGSAAPGCWLRTGWGAPHAAPSPPVPGRSPASPAAPPAAAAPPPPPPLRRQPGWAPPGSARPAPAPPAARRPGPAPPWRATRARPPPPPTGGRADACLRLPRLAARPAGVWPRLSVRLPIGRRSAARPPRTASPWLGDRGRAHPDWAAPGRRGPDCLCRFRLAGARAERPPLRRDWLSAAGRGGAGAVSARRLARGRKWAGRARLTTPGRCWRLSSLPRHVLLAAAPVAPPLPQPVTKPGQTLPSNPTRLSPPGLDPLSPAQLWVPTSHHGYHHGAAALPGSDLGGHRRPAAAAALRPAPAPSARGQQLREPAQLLPGGAGGQRPPRAEEGAAAEGKDPARPRGAPAQPLPAVPAAPRRAGEKDPAGNRPGDGRAPGGAPRACPLETRARQTPQEGGKGRAVLLPLTWALSRCPASRAAALPSPRGGRWGEQRAGRPLRAVRGERAGGRQSFRYARTGRGGAGLRGEPRAAIGCPRPPMGARRCAPATSRI